jgi:hypothetical protein
MRSLVIGLMTVGLVSACATPAPAAAPGVVTADASAAGAKTTKGCSVEAKTGSFTKRNCLTKAEREARSKASEASVRQLENDKQIGGLPGE